MPKGFRYALLAGFLSAVCLFDFPLSAQATLDLQHVRATDRLVSPIDDNVRVRLPGNRHPLARQEYDAGRVAADVPMERILLTLRPDETQQQALEALLAAQQDPQSPLYQQWQTPEEFGSRFGISDNDLGTIVSWLEAKGFQVEPVSSGRRVVVFSGTVGQVEAAFHTEIHAYQVNGELHRANASDPEIPAALAPLAGGLVSLHDFVSKPLHVAAADAHVVPDPQFTTGGAHYVAPADFATIYDLAPLYASSTDGTGYTIAIAGRSNILLTDVETFRSRLGLAAKDPKVILNGPDPGVLAGGEQGEAELDVEWSGAVARNATVELVVSASTSTSDGVALSAQYIVNQNLSPVISVSFGECEAAMGAAGNQFWNALWQQAAAQGMSVFVASGDSGAAGCDDPSATTATGGQAVNGLCSSPYSTCVGGTEFNDTANPALYWSPNNNASTYASALSYIPETAWNESNLVAGGSGLWAGGGGASIVYTKPAWQTGTGVPAANYRYVPDVALSAAAHDGYLVCMNGQFYAFAGTSVAAPSFAGLVTLAVARQGARQGNVNPILYGLAAQQANGGTAVFHDVTAGNNSVNGVTGFSAAPGYDPVTGWGSVDANLLVNSWANGTKPVPSFQIAAPASGTSVTQGTSGTLKVSVTTGGGFNAAIALSAGSLPSGLTANFLPATIPAPGSGSSTLTLTAASQLTPGVYNIGLVGTGGGISQTVPLAVTVAPRCTYTLNPASAEQPPAAGSYTFNVAAAAGCSWTAASNASWITVPKGASGAGTGQVSYSLAANTGAARTGTLTIAGSTFQVVQDSSNFSLNPTAASMGANGGNGTASLTAPSAKSTWTAKSNVNWITIANASASGSGSAGVSYSVAPNTAATARTGTLTIAGLTFTVTQLGMACTYSLKLGAITPVSSGFTGSLSVVAATGCAWSATSNATWITVNSGASGSGNGTVSFAVAANPAAASRTGTMTVAGYTVSITEGSRTAAQVVKPLGATE